MAERDKYFKHDLGLSQRELESKNFPGFFFVFATGTGRKAAVLSQEIFNCGVRVVDTVESLAYALQSQYRGYLKTPVLGFNFNSQTESENHTSPFQTVGKIESIKNPFYKALKIVEEAGLDLNIPLIVGAGDVSLIMLDTGQEIKKPFDIDPYNFSMQKVRARARQTFDQLSAYYIPMWKYVSTLDLFNPLTEKRVIKADVLDAQITRPLSEKEISAYLDYAYNIVESDPHKACGCFDFYALVRWVKECSPHKVDVLINDYSVRDMIPEDYWNFMRNLDVFLRGSAGWNPLPTLYNAASEYGKGQEVIIAPAEIRI